MRHCVNYSVNSDCSNLATAIFRQVRSCRPSR